MKNRDLYRYPTADELYALERAAHAARSAAIARLLRRAFDVVAKGLHRA
ncbi:MAG TPA: hypothetical protein VEQ87_22540 [Burkholderiales bacterium]|nr:hypothetical protein [Burkholderiales bacterium]